jgi:hypothetical protein
LTVTAVFLPTVSSGTPPQLPLGQTVTVTATRLETSTETLTGALTESPTETLTKIRAPPPESTQPQPPLRDGKVVAGTALGVVVQFAIRGIGAPLAGLRASGISSTLRRIGSAEGCRGQDPTAAPEWLTSPLQLGMAGGRDYVVGTAVGAPFVVAIATFVGALVGVATHLLDVCVWARLRRHLRRSVLAPPHPPSEATDTLPAVAPQDDQLERRPWYHDERLFAAAAGGAANLMLAASALVSQPAVAAAVLRLAEGPAPGTAGRSYAVGALLCALLSFVLPMAALHLAWPRDTTANGLRETRAGINPTPRVQTPSCYRSRSRRERVLSAAAFFPGGLRQWRRRYLGDTGFWYAPAPAPAAVTDASSSDAHASNTASAARGRGGVGDIRPAYAVPVQDLLDATLLDAAGLTRPPDDPLALLLRAPSHQSASPAAAVSDPFDLLLPPEVLPGVQQSTRTQRPQRVLSRAAADACGLAWREALYGEYRGHARLVGQFVVASQALQGLAEAAGELVPRDHPDSAWWSCVAASASQLVAMSLCTVLLLWTQPHRTRQNFDAEMLPTGLQAGICAPIALLAARRWVPNATIVALLDAALDASAMLQPLIGVALAVYETASSMDLAAVNAAFRLRWLKKK